MGFSKYLCEKVAIFVSKGIRCFTLLFKRWGFGSQGRASLFQPPPPLPLIPQDFVPHCYLIYIKLHQRKIICQLKCHVFIVFLHIYKISGRVWWLIHIVKRHFQCSVPCSFYKGYKSPFCVVLHTSHTNGECYLVLWTQDFVARLKHGKWNEHGQHHQLSFHVFINALWCGLTWSTEPWH